MRAFTLIELMIVVAIIGVLSAIAIPNFLKFQCRARAAEVRGNLGGIFIAETAFLGGEKGNVYGLFGEIGWQPVGACRYTYTISGGGTNAWMCGTTIAMSISTNQVSASGGNPIIADAAACGNSIAMNGGPAASVITGGTYFLANGQGLPSSNPSFVDSWFIDSNKNLTQTCNGC